MSYDLAATTDFYYLSLHDALPILVAEHRHRPVARLQLAEGARGSLVKTCTARDVVTREREEVGRERIGERDPAPGALRRDRKSTRLNSSHSQISYAVVCLKKKITRSGSTQSLASALWFHTDKHLNACSNLNKNGPFCT